ncbi:hypothetical protein [Methylorubrum populi]
MKAGAHSSVACASQCKPLIDTLILKRSKLRHNLWLVDRRRLVPISVVESAQSGTGRMAGEGKRSVAAFFLTRLSTNGLRATYSSFPQAMMTAKPTQLVSGIGFVVLSFVLWGAACLVSGQIIWC